MADLELHPASWERMGNAIENVKRRLERATTILSREGIHYAVIGGHAVAAWVAKIDESAVRNTRDVDLLVSRRDFDRIKAALEAAGFVYRHAKSLDMFLDGPEAQARDGIHLIFAGEKVHDGDMVASPGLDETREDAAFRVVTLDALVRMKLNSYRRKDQVHLLDMMDVGLIDESWLDRVPPSLRGRLQELFDNPD